MQGPHRKPTRWNVALKLANWAREKVLKDLLTFSCGEHV